jgi:phosphoglycerate dehydrogenase-like enzyme/2-polyprenyl-6-methoxyphenol hydroxylase-like FAD-dependent oxidoreductase
VVKVLVSGAGVAGLSAAINLAAIGHQVTIVERATHLRVNGSPIDVRGDAIGIVAKMGLLQQIRAHQIDMTERVVFVDSAGEALGELPAAAVSDSDEDIEIPREDLTNILHAALPSSVTLVFGDSIDQLHDNADGVDVHFRGGTQQRYDLVVGADGLHSVTRRLVFGPEADFLQHLGFYVALADLPSIGAAPGRVNPMYNYPGHLCGVASYNDKALAIFTFRSTWIDYDYHDLDAQKQILRDAFAGHDEWQLPALLAAAQGDPELYFDSVSLIQLPSWHRGRVVLIGDAAHCASGLSGRGTSLAITGAFSPAQAFGEFPGDYLRAFERYESDQRPLARAAQAMAAPGGDLLVPATGQALTVRNQALVGPGRRPKVAILDDYAGVALDLADWSAVRSRADITVFDRHLSEDEAARALQPFDVVCTLRERMALPRRLIEQLPNLKLITIVGMDLPNLDMQAATDHGVVVTHPDFTHPRFHGLGDATPELAWGLLLATVRNLAEEHRRMCEGGWQTTAGVTLSGKTLGIVGLGRLGTRMAEYAKVFGMDVIAWSQNLTAQAAASVGVRRVDKQTLFAEADIVSISLVLSERTRGIVAKPELALMKPTAYLINTARGPIVDEAALIEALRTARIAGAGLDVYDVEPLPPDHPLRLLPNVTLSPHLGYVTREMLAAVYADTTDAVAAWLSGKPIRVINAEALPTTTIS